MKQYETNKKYKALSKKEKTVFDLLGSFDFRIHFQLLDFEKKIRLISAAEESKVFYDKDGNILEEETEMIRDDLSRSHHDILFYLYNTLDLFWVIQSEFTDKPYIFRENDNSKLVGTYLFSEERTAEKKIKELELNDCYIEPIDDPYEFIRHGVEMDGYEFVKLFTEFSCMTITEDDFLWDNNAPLTARLNEYAQLRQGREETQISELKETIAKMFSESELFLPASVVDEQLHFNVDTSMIKGKKVIPVYTSFEEYRDTSEKGSPVCLFLSSYDILMLTESLGLSIVINPWTSFFAVDDEFANIGELLGVSHPE